MPKFRKKILKAARKMTPHLQGKASKISDFSPETMVVRGSGTTYWKRDVPRRLGFVGIVPQWPRHLFFSILYNFFHYSPHYRLLMVSESLCRKCFTISISTNSSLIIKNSPGPSIFSRTKYISLILVSGWGDIVSCHGHLLFALHLFFLLKKSSLTSSQVIWFMWGWSKILALRVGPQQKPAQSEISSGHIEPW